MPDTELFAADQFLLTIGRVNGEMAEFAELCRKKTDVFPTVHRGCEIQNFTNVTSLQSYVEATIPSGTVYCWWFELKSDGEGWTLERSVLKNTDDGQESMIDLPDHRFVFLNDFLSKATELTIELTRAWAPSTEEADL